MSYRLRDYQLDLKNRIYKSLAEGRKAPLVVSPTGCVAGSTLIRVNRAGGGYNCTISEEYISQQDPRRKLSTKTKVRGLNPDYKSVGLIEASCGIVFSGIKHCIKVSSENRSVILTPDHRIFTEDGWVEAKDMLGKSWAVDTPKPVKNKQKIYVKPWDHVFSRIPFHPYARLITPTRLIDKPYKSIERHRAIYEAKINCLTLEGYKRILRSDPVMSSKLKYMNPATHEIHHINGNHKDNRSENLTAITIEEHARVHAHENYSKFSQGKINWEPVVRIEQFGMIDTYDVVGSETESFTANDVVVHNSGKAVTLCSFAYDMGITQGLPTVISAHRKELVSQLCVTLSRAGVPHNIIAPKNVVVGIIAAERRVVGRQYYDHRALITVMSVDTLNARIDRHKNWAEGIRVWIQDEAAHVLKTNKWGKSIAAFPNAIGVGFTATPQRLDKRGLGVHADGVFDDLILGPSTKYLINEGYLSKYKIVVPPGDYEKHLVKANEGSDFTREAMAVASKESHIIGDVVENYLKFCKNKLAIVFATDIDAAFKLEKEFISKGVTAKTLTGETPDQERSQGILDFEEERTKVLINVDLFDEGFDCLDYETEILTPNGWCGLNNIGNESDCYAWDSKTFKIKKVPILNKGCRITRPDERMFEIKSQHNDVRVTEGHRIYWRAKDYYTKDFMSTTVTVSTATEIYNYKKPFSLPLNGEMDFPGLDLTDDEIMMMGWALTDGYIGKDKALYLFQAKPWFVTKIKDLLKRLDWKFTEKVKAKEHIKGYGSNYDLYIFRISNKNLRWSQIKHLFSKDLHNDLHNMTKQQFKILWDSMMDGDGHKAKNKSGKLCTSRKRYADFFMHMASLRGFAMMYGNYYTKNDVLIYDLGMREKSYIQLTKRDNRGAKFSLNVPTKPEMVWCVQNELGTLITRRKGKIAILGNCPGIECVIMGRPTMSVSKYLQMVGRSLRIKEGKEFAIIIDHVGNIKRHGLPDQHRTWTLDRIVKRRDTTNLLRICSNMMCNAPYDKVLEACPYCGTEYIKQYNRSGGTSPRQALIEVDGDLMLLDPDTIRELEAEIHLESPEELADRVAMAAGVPAGIRAGRNQRERIEMQKQLANTVSLWAGRMKHFGYSDRQIHKKFFLTYDMSITGALSLKKAEMESLEKDIKDEIGV